MKKLLCMLLLTTLVFAFPMGALAQKDTLLFGYANHNSDEPSLVQMRAFLDAAAAWNAAGNTPKVEVTTAVSDGILDRQLSDIETMVAMGCDAIYIHAIDFTGILPAIQNCLASGVKVMEARGLEMDGILTFYVGNEQIMAENMYKYLKGKLESDPDLVLSAGLIYGNAAQTPQLIRVNHVVTLLEANFPGRINVLASQPCDWDTQKAQECMENWLQKYQGTMNCIISAAGMMACGACNAVIAAGEDLDNWHFVTVDSTADVLHSISQGQVDMTVGIDMAAAGAEAMEVLVKYVLGEVPDGIYNCEPMVVIDASNIADWYG